MTAFVNQDPGDRQLIRPGYSGMSPAEREQWAARWLTLLDGGEAGLSPQVETSRPANGSKDNSTGKRKPPRPRQVKGNRAHPR